MKKLINKLVFLFLITLLSLGILSIWFFKCIAPQYNDSYTASLVDKYNYITSIDQPKIVLLGDSNVAFGFKSELIEDAFDMPVVNMALQSGLGNAFLENLAKINVTEGDIYILCHSTYSDDGKFLDSSLAWVTLENNFELWNLLTLKQASQLPAAFPYYLRNAIGLRITNRGNSTAFEPYSRDSFNEYGDISYIRAQNQFQFTSQTVPNINETCTNRINELSEYLAERGAVLYISAYPIGYGEYTPNASEYIDFQEELDSRLDCTIISDFTDYFFEYKYFFDSELHLTDEGATLRTEQLILDLKTLK